MQINQEFLCFEQNEKIIEELALKNNHQEIINFCDRQIYFIKTAQINQQEGSTHILDDSQELNKTIEYSSGSILLQKIDSFVNKFQIEHAYEIYYKKKIKSLQILQRYDEIIECCDQLLILCQENNQELYCKNEKAKALFIQGSINEFIKLISLEDQENKHNVKYYKQIVKDLKNQGLIKEAIACLDYGIQNDQFKEQFYLKKVKLQNLYCHQKSQQQKNEQIVEAEACQKQLDNLELS